MESYKNQAGKSAKPKITITTEQLLAYENLFKSVRTLLMDIVPEIDSEIDHETIIVNPDIIDNLMSAYQEVYRTSTYV